MIEAKFGNDPLTRLFLILLQSYNSSKISSSYYEIHQKCLWLYHVTNKNKGLAWNGLMRHRKKMWKNYGPENSSRKNTSWESEKWSNKVTKMDRLIKFTRRLKQISLLHLATVGNHPGWWTILKNLHTTCLYLS